MEIATFTWRSDFHLNFLKVSFRGTKS